MPRSIATFATRSTATTSAAVLKSGFRTPAPDSAVSLVVRRDSQKFSPSTNDGVDSLVHLAVKVFVDLILREEVKTAVAECHDAGFGLS